MSTLPVTDSNQIRCLFMKTDGNQCEAKPLRGESYCFSHSQDENLSQKRTDARQRGGKNSRGYGDELIDEKIPIVTMQDVVTLLSDTINRVRAQTMSPQRANCIGYLLNVAVKAIEKKDLEARIDHLESLFEARK